MMLAKRRQKHLITNNHKIEHMMTKINSMILKKPQLKIKRTLRESEESKRIG